MKKKKWKKERIVTVARKVLKHDEKKTRFELNKARIENKQNILMKKNDIFPAAKKNGNLPRYTVHNFDITCKHFKF